MPWRNKNYFYFCCRRGDDSLSLCKQGNHHKRESGAVPATL